jgi:hypothetical protein
MQKIDAKEFRREFIGESDGTNLSVDEHQSKIEALVERAIEYLRIGHEMVQSAELAKCASEAALQRYRDEIKGPIERKLQIVEEQMKREAAELAAAKQKALAAEKRADKAEAALKRLENEVRPASMVRRALIRRVAA